MNNDYFTSSCQTGGSSLDDLYLIELFISIILLRT